MEEIDFKARVKEIYGDGYEEPRYYRKLSMGLNHMSKIISNNGKLSEDEFQEIWNHAILSSYGSLCDPRICSEEDFSNLRELTLNEARVYDDTLNRDCYYEQIFDIYFQSAKRIREDKYVDIESIINESGFNMDSKLINSLKMLSNPVLDLEHLEYWGYEWWK